MPTLFNSQFHAVQNKTSLAIYSIYSVLYSILTVFVTVFVTRAKFYEMLCKISACRFLNH